MRGKNRLFGQQFFQGVRPETVERLWHKGQVKEFSKGSLVIRAKEPMDYVCFQL